MSKNILLATINHETIDNLSTFTMVNTARNTLNALYKQARKPLEDCKKRMLSFHTVWCSKHIATDEIELYTRNVYHSNGISNVPYNFLPDESMHSRRDTLTTVEEVNSRLERYEAQYKARLKSITEGYNNAILNTIPSGMYEAYKYGMTMGSYDSAKKGTFSFNKYASAMLKNMGLVGAEDDAAVRKYVNKIDVFLGGNFRRGRGILEKSENEFNQLMMEAIIVRFTEASVLILTDKGYRKLSKEEAEARKAKIA